MNTLLAILLYMQLQSPATYNKVYIDQLELQYHAQIQIIEGDPLQMQQVQTEYLPLTPNIIITFPDETRLPKASGYFACEIDNYCYSSLN